MWTSIDRWLKTATRLDSAKSFPLTKVGWAGAPLTLTPKASALRGNGCLYHLQGALILPTFEGDEALCGISSHVRRSPSDEPVPSTGI